MSYRRVNNKTENASGYLAAIIAGFKQISHTPLASLFIVLVITFALFLATAFYILWSNVNILSGKWNESAEISLYLKKKVGLKVATDLVEKLQPNSAVAKITMIQPGEGMKGFIESIGFNTLLSSFKENPLPQVIIIQPKIKVLSKNLALEFIKELKSYPEVETVKADVDWIGRGHNLLKLWDKLSLFLLFILIANALIVICGVSYTVSQIFVIRDNAPKITLRYQFAWYGLIGSLFALLLVRLVAMLLQEQHIFLQTLDIGREMLVVLVSVFLSFFSARYIYR